MAGFDTSMTGSVGPSGLGLGGGGGGSGTGGIDAPAPIQLTQAGPNEVGGSQRVTELVDELNRIDEEIELFEIKLEEVFDDLGAANKQRRGDGLSNKIGGKLAIGRRLRNLIEGENRVQNNLILKDPILSELTKLDRDRFRVERELFSILNNNDPFALNRFERQYRFRDRFEEFDLRAKELGL